MEIFVDIDGTICQTIGRNYESSQPIPEHIAKINRLYDEGNTIVYYSARGQVSGTNYKALTLSQLREWGCKFHNLVLGHKPPYDLMICDKTKRIEEI